MGYKRNYNSLLPDDFMLSEEFETIIEQLENTKDHFYITGKAGSGKSTLLAYFRSITKKNTAVLAPTGVAAIRVKGQTIHSFFGFPPKVIQTRHIKKVRQIEVLQNLETLIIDEVSMVRADVFDAIDYSLRVHRKKLTQPFGGVQLVVFGDLFQLPPVVNMDESGLLQRIYSKGHFFFHSNIFQDAQFKTLELYSIYRQKDDHFIHLLNSVRDGSITHSQIDNINDSLIDHIEMDEGKIILTTTNARASSINQKYLSQLNEEEFSYRGQATGQFYKELFPTDEILKLKKGAQVIMIKNDPEKRWVNGSIGIIHDIAQKKIKVKIGNKIFEVKKEKWDRIQYTYDDNQQDLNNISFKINPGESFAIVGPTGSGKTTITNLITKFYEVDTGNILIDGKDINHYTLETVRSKIGVILQDVFLFADTIFNNITLFNKDITMENVENAAKELEIHDFINSLPGGYSFNVSERGATLSAGQKQLIAFLRVLVNNPDILILDEATSSIDSYSEELLKNATKKITKDKTSIIIAHRLSTIESADKIIYMENGKILESGNHKQLLSISNGKFKKLYEEQFVEELV